MDLLNKILAQWPVTDDAMAVDLRGKGAYFSTGKVWTREVVRPYAAPGLHSPASNND